jgi:hypothetical protein
MNKDIRLSMGFLDHHKTVKMERRLGWPGVKSLLRLWFFAAENRPEGTMTGMTADDVEIAAQWGGKPGDLISALVELKWVDQKIDVYLLHNWSKRNGYVIHSKEREDKARRAAEARWGKKTDAQGMLQALPVASSSNAPSPAPNPNPNPNPTPKDLKTFAESDHDRLPPPPKSPVKPPKVPLSLEGYNAFCRERLPTVLQTNRDVWAKAYPAVDLDQETAAALGWLLTHPRERKSDFPRFLNAWMNRTQNRARAKAGSGNGGNHGAGTYRRGFRAGGVDQSTIEEQERINRELREARARKAQGNPVGDAGDDHRPDAAVPDK